MPNFTIPSRDNDNTAIPSGAKKAEKKARSWLVLDSTGQTQVVEAGKHAIMGRTGLLARDLRVLDPLLSYPSTILGRERSIVINLEHIKAIIMAQEVLLLNHRDPSVDRFVVELQQRILRTENSGPFEFVALETCLEATCSCLDNEARTLDQEARPALDKLTRKVTNVTLERVRQIKTRLVATTGRVHEVKNQLEHLLDDDEDMAKMYLTDKQCDQNSMDDDDVEIPMDAGSISHKYICLKKLEMLLEVYFVLITGTLNKLDTLREYVDDKKGYIKIKPKLKRNQNLKMCVMLSAANIVVAAFQVVAGILGMNIKIELFDETKAGMREFLWTIGGGTTGSLFLYVLIIAINWGKLKLEY